MFPENADIPQELNEMDEGAFAAIMRKYYSVLYRYGQHFTHDASIIDDCIQDVFINLWQNRHKTKPVAFMQQYLLIALKRRIIRVLQQDKKRLSLPGEQMAAYQFTMEFSIEDMIIEKQLDEEKAAKLRQIMNQLSSRQKEVIYLIYYQQLDHKQVAEIMQINRQSVYNLLHESLRKIKAFWQEASVAGLWFVHHL